MVKTVQWDRVISSTPLNTDAAKARDGGGVHWEPEIKQAQGKVRSHAPFPMKPIKSKYKDDDLTGLKVGKLTVIGLGDFPGRSKKSPAAWVVRCVCSYYETRTAKTLRNPEYAKTAACDECNYLAELKAGLVKRPTVAERTAGKQ